MLCRVAMPVTQFSQGQIIKLSNILLYRLQVKLTVNTVIEKNNIRGYKMGNHGSYYKNSMLIISWKYKNNTNNLKFL